MIYIVCSSCSAPIFGDTCKACGARQQCGLHKVQNVRVNYPNNAEPSGKMSVCPQCEGGRQMVEAYGIAP